MYKKWLCSFFIFVTLSHLAGQRIMTYNVLNYQGSISGDSDKEIALRMVINSADPDIIVVEELNNTTGYNRFLSHILNYNQEGIYSGADFTNQSTADADIALYYKPGVFSFVSTSVINTTNNWGHRDVIEFIMKHIESNEEIRLYGLHLKAGTGGDDETEREQEATALRDYLNTLNPSEHFFVLGDFNFYDSNEGGFQVLTESQEDNDGQVFDPINRIGNWHNNSSFSDVHTQSTRATNYGDGGASGGMDDRFDFILVSSSILDETDMNYLEDSYTPYGNDGDHFNQSINAGNNSAVPDEIADALYVASDHLPVYLDVVFSGTLPPLRQIVISEIMPNPSLVSDSNGEWLEVYNADSVTIDFAGWTIKDAGTDEHLISTQEGSLLIEPEEYFVFGRNANQNENGGYEADYEYSGIIFGSAEDEIILLDPEGREVDEVYYTNAFPFSSGASMYVQDLSSNNNIVSNWAESTTPYGLGDFGTPGLPNNLSGVLLEIDNIAGWNLVGLPAGVEDGSLSAVYPEGTGGTLYSYNGAYVGVDALVSGEGYWLHFPDAGTTTITGAPISSLTVSLTAGWNLFSGISEATNVSGISDPGGVIVAGTVYGFSGAYAGASVLTPGHGYWVNASADGDITISSGGAAKTRSAFTDRTKEANKLSFNGNDLYFGVSIPEEEMLSYQLPPKPPVGAFDVRFSGDYRIATDKAELEVMNPSQTLTISYDVVLEIGGHMNWVLNSESGEEYTLEGTGEITVPTEETFTLERKEIIPISYALHQNYPNPFNPITSLRYDLPKQAQVTLTVYDILGREVTHLVNTTQEAGYRSVQWNATDSFGSPVSAGVYLCQIRSGEFVQTKKMVLLK